MFALTRSSNDSRVASSLGKRLLCGYFVRSVLFWQKKNLRWTDYRARNGRTYIAQPSLQFFSGPVFRICHEHQCLIVLEQRSNAMRTPGWIWFRRKHVAAPYSPGSGGRHDSGESWMEC